MFQHHGKTILYCFGILLCIFACIHGQDTDKCSVVINELNTDEPHVGSQEYSEFIELKLVCPKSSTGSIRLRDYLVIGVQEYHGEVRKPVVTFSADFYRSGFKENKQFFVIASKEKQTGADMYFTDSSIGYKGKVAAQLQSKTAPSGSNQASIVDFFKSASKALPTEPNALKNGNGKSAMAIILLHQRDFSRSDDVTDSIGKLRLAKMHSSTRRPTFQDQLTIDDSLAEIIKHNIHDMIIYARSTLNNRCAFFESVYSTLKDKPDYVLKPAREWDEAGHIDYSINRCPTSASEVQKPLLFTRWKLGHLTPGEENDCSGAHWILEENIEAIVNAPSVSASASSTSSSTRRTEKPPPPECAASSHRSEMALAVTHSEEIASNRDHAVETAEIADHGENAMMHAYCSPKHMQQEKNDLLETDQRTSVLQTEFGRQITIQRKSMKRSSCRHTVGVVIDSERETDSDTDSGDIQVIEERPQRKKLCSRPMETECTPTTSKKEWEDMSNFKEEWLDSLQAHQGRYFSKTFVTSEMKAWLVYVQNSEDLSKSTLQCRFCLNYVQSVPKAALQLKKHKSSFATTDGYIPSDHVKDSVRRKLQRHSSNALHRDAIMWMKEKYNSILAKQVEQINQAIKLAKSNRDEITARVLTTVYVEAKANVPFSAHYQMIDLQKKNGLDMGTHHRHRKSATAMAASISTTMHNSLLKYIQTSESLPIAIILDTTSDTHSNGYLMIYFRMLEKSKPIMYFYRFKRLTEVETGRSIHDMLIALFNRDNLQESISERLWGVTTDGASVMTGKHVGLVSMLRPWAKKKFFQHHCAAHKLELSIYHAFESFPYMQHLDSNINALHKFYTRHAIKRKASLTQTSEAMEQVFYELKRIYRIRWVASEVSALDVIRKSYYILLTNLENIRSPSSDFDEDSKATAAGLLKTLQNVRYYSLQLFITDVLKQLSFQSLQFQSAKGTFIGLQKRHNDLITSLENLKTRNGPQITEFLVSCKCRRVIGPGEEPEYRSRCHTSDLSRSNFLCPSRGRDMTQKYELKQPCSRLTRLERHACTSDADVADRGTGVQFPALDDIRSTIIDSIITQLRRYFPEEDYAIFDVLNPELLPTTDTIHSVFTYSSQIIPLARRFGMQDDDSDSEGSHSESESTDATSRVSQRTISGQFNILIHSLIAHKVDFCAYRSKGPVQFWTHFLEKNTVEWLPKIKLLIQIVLTLPISSAEAERGFSIYKHIAYDRRTRLSPENLEHLLRIRINGPPLSKFVPDVYVNDWLQSHWASDAPGGRQQKGLDDDEEDEKSELRSGLF